MFVIGIDLGGMSAVGALSDGEKLLQKMRVETHASDPFEKTAHDLAELALSLAAACGAEKKEISAIGIGAPGVVDSGRGVVVRWTNFGWENVPLAETVSKETGLPVFVTNDANAAALGEAKFGSGKGYSDSVLLTLGTGVGSGIVLGGKLFEGTMSAGGELGHTVIRRGGILCTCGRRGCLECYASATALKRETRLALMKHGESLMWEGISDLSQVSGKTPFLAEKKGDKTAIKVVREYIECLGDGIANIVNILRPQAVILGGGVSNEGENLIGRVREYVKKNIVAPYHFAPFDIVRATLGNDAGVYGAFAYALSRIEQTS